MASGASGWDLAAGLAPLAPALSILHAMALVVMLAAVLAFDLTVLGLDPDIPVQRAGAILLPVARAAFLVLAGSGLLLFLPAAGVMLAQTWFRTKLLLVALALSNVAFFHRRAGRALRGLADGAPPAWARLAALGSLMFWLLAAGCGCLLSYP